MIVFINFKKLIPERISLGWIDPLIREITSVGNNPKISEICFIKFQFFLDHFVIFCEYRYVMYIYTVVDVNKME